MAAPRVHRYQLELKWTGNTGSGTSGYAAYSRNHELSGACKAGPVPLSSDAAFRGDASRFNPEELLVGSLSSCHMLWMLHLCSEAGIVVVSYDDAPEGSMRELPSGAGEFTEVTLQPLLSLQDPGREDELEALHRRAHELCFISRSVNFPVHVRMRRQIVKSL